MAMNTYYFEIRDRARDITPGVYNCQNDHHWRFSHLELYQLSDRVWQQGPRGGVKIVKDRSLGLYPMGYITANPKWMKKFTWVKLQAQPL
jgi:hypothetical protein